MIKHYIEVIKNFQFLRYYAYQLPTTNTKQIFILLSYFRDNPTKAEMQTMDKNCLPIFKYFRSQRKSKVLVHGFGDSAEDSLMFPLLRDGRYTWDLDIIYIHVLLHKYTFIKHTIVIVIIMTKTHLIKLFKINVSTLSQII